MRPQWSHSKSGYIFEKPLFFCVKWRVLQLSPLIFDFRVYIQFKFSPSNGEWYISLGSFWIFGFIPRIFCTWNPNDRTVKLETYLKSLKFFASKYYTSLRAFWIFKCTPRVWVIWQTLKLHGNGEDIFEKVWSVYVRYYKWVLWLVSGLQKEAKLTAGLSRL